MAEKTPLDDAELDGLFQAARDAAPRPSDDLIARIVADAEAGPQAARPPAHAAPGRPGRFAGILAAIGGWPAAAGLATAAAAGLMVGYATPDALQDLSGGLLAASDYRFEDLLPSYGDILVEG